MANNYPRAAGYPANSGIYIPELWHPSIIARFYENCVMNAIANTDYEGEIKKFGDTVHIRQYPDITVFNYTKGQSLPVQTPSSTTIDLLINKGKGFNVLVDEIDEVQSDINMLDSYTETAGKQLAVEVDKDVLQGSYADAATGNYGATAGVTSERFDLGASGAPVALDKTNILEKIVDIGTVLDEQNVPESDRWIILPPVFTGYLSKSDLKNASDMGDSKSVLRTGRIGEIDRFTIYQSNNLKTASDSSGHTAWYCLAGHKIALAFASQLEKTESIKSEDTFGMKVRGLQVYGYKVVKDTAFSVLYAYAG